MKRLPQRMLIVSVGPNFTGKTATSNKLAHELAERTGQTVRVYRLYKDGEKKKGEEWLKNFTDPMEKIFYYSMLFHRQRKKIESALAKGYIVIAERFIDDAMVGMSTGDIANNREARKMLLRLVFGNLKPNITFLLRVSSSVANQRLATRPEEEVTESDLTHAGLHDRVSEAYAEVSKKTGAITISSEGTVDETVAKMLQELGF